MEFPFFVGLCFGGLGSFAVLKTLHKKELIKLKRYFSSQQETYEDQFQSQRDSYEAVIEQQANYEAKLTTLQTELHQQVQEQKDLLQQLAQEKELNKIQQRKLRESNQDIDEILESLEQSQQEVISLKEKEISALKAQNTEFAINLEQQKVELFTLKQQFASNVATLDAANENSWSQEQIEELLTALFPDVTLLRDSVAVLVYQPENLVKLIKAIKDICEGNAYSPTKVRATDKKWTECRVPHINLMRIYFQKCKKVAGYQVLISPKKNQKSQDQDYEWLKSHSAC
ncbi:MAG: hypothetical protein WBB82_12145 [Limnothrix sp.]